MMWLITSPWVQAIAAVITIFGALLALLRKIQSLGLPRDLMEAEEIYLRGLVKYVHNLNIRSAFDESLFVERTFNVKNKYQPRSFFVASHKSFLSKLSSSSTEAAAKAAQGYRTKGLMSEVVKSAEPLVILGEPGSGKSVSARQLAVQVATSSLKSKQPTRLLPIFISLGEYTATDPSGAAIDFYTYLSSVLGSRNQPHAFATEFFLSKLDEYLDAGRILFILDSLDEMPPGTFRARCEFLTAFMLRYSSNVFVITCRSNDFATSLVRLQARNYI
jgi:predicted NACHT family NTPase